MTALGEDVKVLGAGEEGRDKWQLWKLGERSRLVEDRWIYRYVHWTCSQSPSFDGL